MKNTKVLTVLLAAGLAFSTPLIANAKGESQKGGLPGLEDRVEADEALITTLQGQNNWAVVKADGTLVRSFSTAGPVTVEHVGTGLYEVHFSKDVSVCAYEATIGDASLVPVAPTQGQISVAGDVNAEGNGNVNVFTYGQSGLVATDSPFHLTVTCP